jgi:hypothetical protein
MRQPCIRFAASPGITVPSRLSCASRQAMRSNWQVCDALRSRTTPRGRSSFRFRRVVRLSISPRTYAGGQAQSATLRALLDMTKALSRDVACLWVRSRRCAQVSHKPNWRSGCGPASPRSPDLKAAKRCRAPRRSCAMPRRRAASFTCGHRRLDAAFVACPATILWKIVERRATADEDGHYSFAVAL